MFSKTFRVTMKTIVRSPLTWAAVTLMLGSVIFFVIRSNYVYVDIETMETIQDTDPRFVLTYSLYIQHVFNTLRGKIMLFGVPLLCVIVSGTILTRDWHDNFFEIERAGNIRPLTHYLGRFSAVFLFLSTAALITYLFAFHTYIITRGGVPDFGPWEYIVDSNTRLLRLFFITGIPGILIFTAVTFFLGNLARSGMVGTIGGIVYVLFEFLTKAVLPISLPQIYHNYLTPTSSNLYQYWAYYDTEWFNIKFPYNPFTKGEMLLCLGVLYFVVIMLSFVSYLCVKHRKI